MNTFSKHPSEFIPFICGCILAASVTAGTATLAAENAPLARGERRLLAQGETDRKAQADRLFQQGIEQFQVSQFREALQSWEQALVIYRQIGDRGGEAASLGNLGNAYQSLGQYQQAIAFQQQSLDIARDIGNRRGERTSLRSLGTAYDSLGEYQRAIEFYQQSLDIDRETRDRRGEANSLGNLGTAYNSLGEYQRAIKYYQQSLDIDRETEDRRGEAVSLGGLGNVYQSLGQYQQAIEFHQQSLDIDREIGNRQGEATSLMNLGIAYNSLGEYERAIESYQQSLYIKREIGDRRGEASCLGNLGNVYHNLGQYQRAIEFHQHSLEIHRIIGSRQGEVHSLVNLGNAYSFLGEYQQAIKFHQQSLEIARDIGDRQGEASCLGNLGTTYGALGQYQQEIKYHQQSLEIARDIGNRQGEAVSLGSLGSAYDSLEEYQQAIKFYQQSLEIAQEIGDRLGETYVLNNLGLSQLKVGKLYDAETTLRQGIVTREQLRESVTDSLEKAIFFEGQAHTYRLLQEVLVARNKPEAALEISERGRTRAIVEFLAERLGVSAEPPSIADIRQIANVQNATLVEYSIIYDTLEIEGQPRETQEVKLYIWVVSPDGDIEFRSVDLAKFWKRQNAGTFWQQVTATGKTIAPIALFLLTLASLISLALWWRFRQHRRPISRPFVPWVLGVVALSSIVALGVTFSPNSQTATRGDSDNLENWQPPLSPLAKLVRSTHAEINTETRGLGQVISEKSCTDDRCLRQLHQILIEPIADLLPDNEDDRVIFIPDRDLFFVPFAALKNADGRYLIEDRTILTAPSIHILELTREQRQKQLAVGANGVRPLQQDNILIVGNPVMPDIVRIPGDDPEPALDPLPNAEREAQKIAQLFNVEPLIGVEATETEIVRRLPTAKIVHFATHGLLDDFYSGGIPGKIALTPNLPTVQGENGFGDRPDDGLLTANEIQSLYGENADLQAELVVLSACQTGLGRVTSDGIIGLSRVFFNSGVPSIVVSLWNVPDASTADLMVEFYQQLDRQPDKAAALRQAMLNTMKTHPDPQSWAAFTLVGEAL